MSVHAESRPAGLPKLTGVPHMGAQFFAENFGWRPTAKAFARRRVEVAANFMAKQAAANGIA
ncbi:hypothetical protein [Rhizobium lusitanum]|uniref:hypothetical protein n=1 Tax=Rhizobium lusitanum TaxID=293958 RepID=UPI0032B1470C